MPDFGEVVTDGQATRTVASPIDGAAAEELIRGCATLLDDADLFPLPRIDHEPAGVGSAGSLIAPDRQQRAGKQDRQSAQTE